VDDSNPARHYVANLAVGFRKGEAVGNGVAVYRELPGVCRGGCSAADVRLGIVGAEHGAALARDAGGFAAMRFGVPTATRHQLADMIRKRL